MVLRNFQSGDDRLFLNLVNAAYRNLETLTTERVKRLLSPPYFEPKGFFIAEEKSNTLPKVGRKDRSRVSTPVEKLRRMR